MPHFNQSNDFLSLSFYYRIIFGSFSKLTVLGWLSFNSYDIMFEDEGGTWLALLGASPFSYPLFNAT